MRLLPANSASPNLLAGIEGPLPGDGKEVENKGGEIKGRRNSRNRCLEK